MTRLIAIIAALTTWVLVLVPSTAIASPGLVGQWKLNEGAGWIALDGSGYGDNGNLLGGAAWANGPDGSSALAFDGATGNVEVPNAPQLQPVTAVSVSAWIERLGSPGAFRYVIAKGASSCTAASYALYSGPNGGLQFYVSRDGGTTYARSPDAGSAVWDGRWHLVVGTFDGTTIKLYVDGTEVGSGTAYPGTIQYLLPDSNNLYIGDYPGCAGKNFLGDIADVEIWDRALTAAEVAAMAQPSGQPPLPGQNPPPTPPAASVGTPGASVGTPGAGTLASTPPLLSKLQLSHSTFGSRAILRQVLISYDDSQPAQVKVTILKLVPASHCFKLGQGNTARRCSRYVAVRHFTHRDHVGRNQLRLPAGVHLVPGAYELVATPTAHGIAGKTVGVTFTVKR